MENFLGNIICINYVGKMCFLFKVFMKTHPIRKCDMASILGIFSF